RLGALEERLARTLHPAHGHGVAFRRALGELALELRPAARVLVAVGDARGAGAIELGHRRHAPLLDAAREGLAFFLETCLGRGIGGAAASAGGDDEGRRLAGMA